MESENKFAFYVSVYYLRVTRLYASAYITYNQIEFNTWLYVCLTCLSILALSVSPYYNNVYVRLLLCKLVYVIIVKRKKLNSILDPHHLSIKIYIQDAIVCKIVLSNEIERRIGNSKHKKTILLRAHYEHTKKNSKKKIPIHVEPIYAIYPFYKY